ncbi:MAG: restriction endonuclease subunit S [Proteobacteria bacterium]|nr:restriction endonuclease subunit S [Pseudomonadota bacterium]MBU0966013.1 restriction endonuclease subunit S [Pseudomonadota bacterium]
MSGEVWKSITLEEAIEFRNGKSSPERKDTGFNPVFGSNGIIGYTEESNSELETIIIGRVGAYCGSVYYHHGKCWVTDNAIIGKVKPYYDGSYLFYLLKIIDLNSHRAGSSQPLINQSILNSIQVTVPLRKATQTRIAAILSALDNKIELNHQTNATLEGIAQAIFKEWFVDFRFPGATDEMQDSELGPIPKGWRVGRLGDILGFKNGKASPERDDTYDYQVYGANGIIGCANSYNSTEKNIVIGRVGSFCGAVYLPLTKIWITDNSIIAEPKAEKTTIFCFILLKQIHLNTYKTGSGQPLLNQNILNP